MLAKLAGIIFSILLALVAGVSSLFTFLEQNLSSQFPVEITESIVTSKLATTTAKSSLKIVSKTKPSPVVIAPEPLSVPVSSVVSSNALSISGVIEYTNIARAQNGGLPPLSENGTLDQDATIKLNDMFAKQYFEHISPSGIGPGELANEVGYAYIVVGENLALGDFGNDEKLVNAWMESPGHRANILNSSFQEIGVAVGKGMYQGRDTWLAVQSFGVPLSACPAIEKSLRLEIDASNTEITNLKTEIDAEKIKIDQTSQNDLLYNAYVLEYNSLIKEYERSISTNHSLILKYNTEVQSFNSCIAVLEAN